MTNQFLVPLSLDTATNIVQTTTGRRFYLPNLNKIVVVLLSADAEHLSIRMQAGTKISPFGWLKIAHLHVTLGHHTNQHTALSVGRARFSVEAVVLWLALLIVGLLLLRFRAVIGVPYMFVLIVWIWATITTTLQQFDRLLMEMFGEATPLKRD